MHAESGLPIQAEFIGIAREVDGKIVAAFGYDSFQSNCCAFHIAALPRGINRQLLYIGFRTPFEQWGFDILIGIVGWDNIRSRNIGRRLGFTAFSELPGYLEFFKMEKANCRWLELAEKRDVRRIQYPPSSRPQR